MQIDKTVNAFLLSQNTLIKNFLVFLIVLRFLPTDILGYNLRRGLSPITSKIRSFMNNNIIRLILFLLLLWACCWKRDMMLVVLLALIMR